MPGQPIGDLSISNIIIYTFGKLLNQNQVYTKKELTQILRKQVDKRLSTGFSNFSTTYCKLVTLGLFQRINNGIYKCVGSREEFLSIVGIVSPNPEIDSRQTNIQPQKNDTEILALLNIRINEKNAEAAMRYAKELEENVKLLKDKTYEFFGLR